MDKEVILRAIKNKTREFSDLQNDKQVLFHLWMTSKDMVLLFINQSNRHMMDRKCNGKEGRLLLKQIRGP